MGHCKYDGPSEEREGKERKHSGDYFEKFTVTLIGFMVGVTAALMYCLMAGVQL